MERCGQAILMHTCRAAVDLWFSPRLKHCVGLRLILLSYSAKGRDYIRGLVRGEGCGMWDVGRVRRGGDRWRWRGGCVLVEVEGWVGVAR